MRRPRVYDKIKTVMKTEEQPRFLRAVLICLKPEAEAFIVFRFNSEILRITINQFFFKTFCILVNVKWQHIFTHDDAVQASKTCVNAVHTYAWYNTSPRMWKHSFSFFLFLFFPLLPPATKIVCRFFQRFLTSKMQANAVCDLAQASPKLWKFCQLVLDLGNVII